MIPDGYGQEKLIAGVWDFSKYGLREPNSQPLGPPRVELNQEPVYDHVQQTTVKDPSQEDPATNYPAGLGTINRLEWKLNDPIVPAVRDLNVLEFKQYKHYVVQTTPRLKDKGGPMASRIFGDQN